MDVRPNSPNTVISRLSLRLSQPPVSVSLPTSQDIKAKSLLLFIYLGLQPWIQKNGRPQMCHGFINLWRYVVCEVIIQGFVLFCPIQKKKKKKALFLTICETSCGGIRQWNLKNTVPMTPCLWNNQQQVHMVSLEPPHFDLTLAYSLNSW